MTPDPIKQPISTAIAQLQAFGLSAYAARMYAGLLQHGRATARDVSEFADVPRTRVYDAGEELLENGFVDVVEESPKNFDPTSAHDAVRKLRREFRYREATLTAVLSLIEDGNDDGTDVRTVTGRQAVVDCLVDAIRSSSEEVIVVTDGTPLPMDVLDALSDAVEEGARIRIVGDLEDHGATLKSQIPEAETVTRVSATSDIPDGTRLLVDGTQAVVTISVSRDQLDDPAIAVWGVGERNLLVDLLKDALTDWFDEDG